MAIAAAGGTSVVQAAGTDAWTSFRHRLGTMMGRGDEQRTEAEIERLERSAATIAGTAPEQLNRVRALQEAVWQARLEDWLESVSAAERENAAGELSRIISAFTESRASEGSRYQGDVRQSAKASGEARIYQLGQGEMRISE